MDTENRKPVRKGFKGSVLFTILVVMLVVLLLMVTTIGLASNSTRRAYSEYFDHQTTSTARSVVDSVINSLKKDNQTLGADIVTRLQNNHATPITVQVNNGNDLGEGFGRVDSLVFSYVADDNATGVNITGSGKPIIKVTATVTQGGTTSTYSQYCIGETKSDAKTSSGGGLVALGGFEATNQPGSDAHSPAYFGVKNTFTYDELVNISNNNNGAFNSLVINSSAKVLTKINFELARKEGITVYGNLFTSDGASNINIKGPDTPSASAEAFANSQITKVNQDIDTAKNELKTVYAFSDDEVNKIVERKPDNSGWTIGDTYNGFGLANRYKDPSGNPDWPKITEAGKKIEDIRALYDKINDINNSKSAFDTLLDYYNDVEAGKLVGGSPVKIEENPYLYVGGTLFLNNGLNVGQSGAPLNIYCGRIVADLNDGHISGNANIYCYNTGSASALYDQTDKKAFGENSWSRLGSARMSTLLSWAEMTANPAANQKTSLDSGYFATLGDLELTRKVQIARDVYVKGDINIHDIDGGSSIGGDVYVDGNINNQTLLESITKGSVIKNPTSLPANFNEFLSGTLTKTNLQTNVIKTTDKLKSQFYTTKPDPNDNTKTVQSFKDAVNKSSLIINADTMVYQGAGSQHIKGYKMSTLKDGGAPDFEIMNAPPASNVKDGFKYHLKITDSCILEGKFEGVNIYIEPKNEIWINMHNVSLDASNIIVDDSSKVNFFMPTDVESSQVDVADAYKDTYKDLAKKNKDASYDNTFTTNSAIKILTLNYWNHIKSDPELKIVTYPTDDTDTTNNWMIPNIGFYAAENYYSDASDIKISFNNNILITADICVPTADFHAFSGCLNLNEDNDFKTKHATIYYNDSKVKSGNLGCIGSVIVNKIKDFHNDFGMAYVDYPSSAKPGLSTGLVYEWTPVDGFADY